MNHGLREGAPRMSLLELIRVILHACRRLDTGSPAYDLLAPRFGREKEKA